MLIDTHSHLYDSAFDADRDQTMERALDNGVGRLLLPAIDSETHRELFNLCQKYPENCFPMMGLHPTSVNDNPEYKNELAIVEKYLENPSQVPGVKFYGIGEVGLDLHWSKDFLKEQIEVFEAQIELSLRHKLPLAIHTRSAWNEMLAVLSKYKDRGLKGVMHSFSGSYKDYIEIKRYGDFMFGIGGVVTYKKSEIQEIVSKMDLCDIVLETDCPYLTPVPFRGKRNESSYLKYISLKIAEIKEMALDEVEFITTENAKRMFSI